MKRVIYLLTGNPHKLPEYQRHFVRYGIEVLAAAPGLDPEGLAREASAERRVLAVLREASSLVRHGTDEPADMEDLERVDNVTQLHAWVAGPEQVRAFHYTYRTEGHVDLSRRAGGDASVFGWDDVFVLRSTQRSYHELRRDGFKVSSRDMALSAFLADFVHYRSGIDLRFNPQQQDRTIDFGRDPAVFVAENVHLSNRCASACGLASAFTHVLNQGVFFRSARNRREKNYWVPGLNAGIPFVPKRDAIHEITYMAHDFGHFLVPDLVYTGGDDPTERRVYIAYRMISEAVTLVLADMLFVDSLARAGFEYDFDQRRIYPLFRATGLDLTGEARLENLRTLLEANVAYCLRGDDRPYRALLARNGKSTDSLDAFEQKYAPFFVEDFRWTVSNLANMAARAAEFRRWWALVRPLRDAAGLELETCEELTARLRAPAAHDVVEQVFERVFETRLRPALETDVALLPAGVRRRRAFLRWAIGQMGLFARFDFVPEAPLYAHRLARFLTERPHSLEPAEVDRARGFFEQFVDILAEKSLISLDDASTFKEVYPLFEPVFAFYDEVPSAYDDLAKVAARALA